MINKINNISFKSAFVNEKLAHTLSHENFEKINVAANIINDLHPQTDVFFYPDKDGDVSYHIQKGDPCRFMIDKEVLKKLKMNIKEMVNFINLKTYLESTHNEIWGIKKPFIEEKVRNIDELDEFDIAYEVNNTVRLFNSIHKNDLN